MINDKSWDCRRATFHLTMDFLVFPRYYIHIPGYWNFNDFVGTYPGCWTREYNSKMFI